MAGLKIPGKVAIVFDNDINTLANFKISMFNIKYKVGNK